MNTKFYVSTNWAVWLALAFGMSGWVFGTFDDPLTVFLLIFLFFWPAIIVKTTLGGFYTIDGQSLLFGYDRRLGAVWTLKIPIKDISELRVVNGALSISYTEGVSSNYVEGAEQLAEQLKAINPEIVISKA